MNVWTSKLRALYEKSVELYRSGNRDPKAYFDRKETNFLKSSGIQPMYLYDLAEDIIGDGEPDWDTGLLIMAARRDYFVIHQKEKAITLFLTPEDLPARDAEMGGIRWLPRLLAKANCFLQGGTCEGIMYCCGGDRAFFDKHKLHPADFLRALWATQGDEKRMLHYVKTYGREC